MLPSRDAEQFCPWRQQQVAKIVHCGEPILLSTLGPALLLRDTLHLESGSKANHARDEPAAIGKQSLPVQATGRG